VLQFIRKPSYDFLGKRHYAYALSGFMVLAGLVSLATRGLNYGVDFRGGTEIHLKFRSAPDLSALRSRLEATGLADISLQRYGTAEENEVLVRVGGAEHEDAARALGDVSRRLTETLEGEEARARRAAGGLDLNLASRADLAAWLGAQTPAGASLPLAPEKAQALAGAISDLKNARGGLLADFDSLRPVAGMEPGVLEMLRQRASLGDFAVRSVDFVGPSVGHELRQKAVWATIGSLFGTLIYLAFRFEYKYGVSAVVTVAHDALLVVGLFSITQKTFDLTVVAAVLTLVGYSLNDTIVIFDRLREDLRLRRASAPLAQMMNTAVNETLSRSILTSLTVLLVVLSLFLFGGDRINDFAFAMLVGVVVGSYSTIYISCPFVLIWEGIRARRRRLA